MNNKENKLIHIIDNYLFLMIGGCISSIILITLIFLFSDLSFNIFLAIMMFFGCFCIFLLIGKSYDKLYCEVVVKKKENFFDKYIEEVSANIVIFMKIIK